MNTVCTSRGSWRNLILVALVLLLVLTACAPPRSPSEPLIIETFEDLQATLKELDSAPPAEAQTRVNELWQLLTGSKRVPLILGTRVVFFYKGVAEEVNWRGSFNSWGAPGVEGFRVGETDLWVGNTEMPEASRAEYKIVINGEEWLVDPANPHTAFSGLTGVNNVVTLPGFHVTDESRKRSEVHPGTLSGTLSIRSDSLNYPVNYWVYTPAGYESLENLPAIYVLDGNDFVDERMGALPTILDNLIADGRIEPVLTVFVDEREPGNLDYNRREDEFLVHPIEHATFIADELAPAIDRTYRTDPRPQSRLIMGVSYGGLSALYIAAARSDVFHNLASFSPSLWVLNNPEYLTDPKQVEGAQQMLPALSEEFTECGGETGFPCPRLPTRVFFSAGLPDWDVDDFSSLVEELEQEGYPVEYRQVREGHTWDHWRGLSDEMLIYFFGIE